MSNYDVNERPLYMPRYYLIPIQMEQNIKQNG